MSSTGARCPACDDQPDTDCERCGGRALAPLAGPASVRGHYWAEHVVKALVSKWPAFWPQSSRAMIIGTRHVADLTSDEVLRARLARICLEAAGRRYSEMIDYLFRRRRDLPLGEWGDDEEGTPK